MPSEEPPRGPIGTNSLHAPKHVGGSAACLGGVRAQSVFPMLRAGWERLLRWVLVVSLASVLIKGTGQQHCIHRRLCGPASVGTVWAVRDATL